MISSHLQTDVSSRFRQMTCRSQIIRPEVYKDRLDLLRGTTEEMVGEAGSTFSGPSVDLHLWAVDARKALGAAPRQPPIDLFKAIFAVLPAWGMHRMGPGATRMPSFADFAASLEAAWPHVEALWTAEAPLNGDQWRELQAAYDLIRARARDDGTQIVSRSKVLLHLLPNICAPIDREYTLGFFHVRTSHQSRSKNPGYEWCLYRELHERFFHVAPKDPRIARFMKIEGTFHTSPMKIIDNLIVANT